MKKEEKLLMAIGGADERLIKEALEVRVRRKPAILRWVAVAACVCLLLASPVGASMVGRLVELWSSEKNVSYHINDRISMENLSDEVVNALNGQEETVLLYPMDTSEDIEAFLGCKLPENEVLSDAHLKNFDTVIEEGKEYRSPCMVRLFGNEEYGLTCVEAKMYYQIENAYIFVMYRAATEQMPYENGGGIGFDVEQFDREDYITEEGLSAVIYKRYTGVDPLVNWSGYAVTTVDGYLVHISVNAPTEQEVVDTMKTLLDAYG